MVDVSLELTTNDPCPADRHHLLSVRAVWTKGPTTASRCASGSAVVTSHEQGA